MSSVTLSHLPDKRNVSQNPVMIFALFWFWLFPFSKSNSLGESQDLLVSFRDHTDWKAWRCLQSLVSPVPTVIKMFLPHECHMLHSALLFT